MKCSCRSSRVRSVIGLPTRAKRLKVCAVPDAAGGDVFCPATPCEAFIAEALRRAGWPHPIWAEVVA